MILHYGMLRLNERHLARLFKDCQAVGGKRRNLSFLGFNKLLIAGDWKTKTMLA
jgi:hypothetical protein